MRNKKYQKLFFLFFAPLLGFAAQACIAFKFYSENKEIHFSNMHLCSFQFFDAQDSVKDTPAFLTPEVYLRPDPMLSLKDKRPYTNLFEKESLLKRRLVRFLQENPRQTPHIRLWYHNTENNYKYALKEFFSVVLNSEGDFRLRHCGHLDDKSEPLKLQVPQSFKVGSESKNTLPVSETRAVQQTVCIRFQTLPEQTLSLGLAPPHLPIQKEKRRTDTSGVVNGCPASKTVKPSEV